MPSQQQTGNTPLGLRDRLQTPDYLYAYAKDRWGFDIDLAADESNAREEIFFTKKDDSLEQDWHLFGEMGWCNPPYSNIKPWFEKAAEQAKKGFFSVWLIPTPNGEDVYRDHIFGKVSEIVFINGRISFISPEDFTVKGKNGKPNSYATA